MLVIPSRLEAKNHLIFDLFAKFKQVGGAKPVLKLVSITTHEYRLALAKQLLVKSGYIEAN